MGNAIKNLIFAAALIASPAMAGTATGSFNVTATVLANCAVSAADLTFGNYAAGTPSAVTASTSISVTCAPALPYTVALDGGSTTGLVGARAMADAGSHKLNYGLYTSNAYTTVFGDGTGASATSIGLGTGTLQSISVYGKIPAAQYVNAGSYSDHISVTVTY